MKIRIIDFLKAIAVAAGTILLILGIFAAAILDEEQKVRICSVCNSQRVTTYKDKRGFLSSQRMYHCYECGKDYPAELLIVRKKEQAK